MGKGDIRTRRGKIFRGTYGTTRLKKKNLKKKKAAEAAKTGKVEGQ
jgi:30S ribosomal protein S31